MATVFQRVKKITKHSNIVIDNSIFLLHYGVTAFILVLFGTLVLCNRCENPVDCSQEIAVPSKLLNAFCHLRPSANIKGNFWNQEKGDYLSLVYNEKSSKMKNTVHFHFGDEWFSLLLLFMALLFIAPHYFWKFMESGRIEILVTLLYNKENSKEENIRQVTEIVFAGAKRNRKYLLSYFGAEIINALNVSSCFVVLGMFYERSSMNAIDVIEFGDINWSPCWKGSCMPGQNLPNLVRCTVNRYGSSEEVLTQQAAMILPTDRINQKIFTFLYYWFYIVTCLSYLVLCYRVFLAISPALRVKVLKRKCQHVNPSDLALIIRALGFENWFLINLLSKNIDPDTFSDSTANLANKIRNDINMLVSEPDAIVY